MPSVGTLEQVVGRNVRTAREMKRMSQSDLGAEAGDWLWGRTIPKQIISKVERGERALDAAELVAFAFVLQVPVQYLLRGDFIPLGSDGHEVQVGDGNWTPTIGELREIVAGREAVAAEEELKREVAEVTAAVEKTMQAAMKRFLAARGGRITIKRRRKR